MNVAVLGYYSQLFKVAYQSHISYSYHRNVWKCYAVCKGIGISVS